MTRKFILIAGVAAMAVTSPASARPERSNGGETRAQKVERPQRAERQQVQRPQRVERQQVQRQVRAERPQRVERQQARRVERPQRVERQQRVERVERAPRVERQRVQRAERPQRVERQHIQRAERPQRVDRQRTERQRIERRAEQPRIERQRIERRAEQRVERRDNGRRVAERLNDNQRNYWFDRADYRRDNRGTAQATPRGLPFVYGRHDMRPMKEAKYRTRVRIGERLAYNSYAPVPTFYRSRYYDTPDYYYRYDDDYGYLYRVNRSNNFVASMIPLYGGYGIGDPWPMTYRSSYVPMGYQPYYYDTSDYYYRYDGNAIYRVDAGTQLIAGIVALLTGNQLGVGQMMPASYGVYNVPMAYRSSYYDTNDAWYRYGDGNIYQIDPRTRRIAASYPMYAPYDDYMIGSVWPTAYPDYNVPYGYRDVYYDTPQYNYRYANGAIYQVDPTSQLINSIVALVSGNTQYAVGQPMPAGYGVYNVPMAYRDRYYDTNDHWYRYADGYVYQVDPGNGLIQDMYPIYA